MTKVLVVGCSFVCSTIGWYVGAPIGVFSAFIGAVVGTAAGVFVGRRLAARWDF